VNNIIVNGQSKYVPELSKIEDSNFYYLYEISIENKGEKKIKLLARHWDIYDALGKQKQVDGEGVIGQHPIINPGESFKYKSYCPLKTEFGSMSGFYTMKDEDGNVFKVEIPEFPLVLDNIIN
jgi:ApaG protein